jgi:hypothetical protein
MEPNRTLSSGGLFRLPIRYSSSSVFISDAGIKPVELAVYGFDARATQPAYYVLACANLLNTAQELSIAESVSSWQQNHTPGRCRKALDAISG